MHVSWSKGYASQVHDPVTERIVTLRDVAVPIAVEGMVNEECSVAAITDFREVWGSFAIYQE